MSLGSTIQRLFYRCGGMLFVN